MLTVLIWLGIIVGSLIALAVLGLLAMIVWTLATGLAPKGVEFDVNAPVLLGRNETFTMAVTVRNLLDRERTFRSLDFEDTILKAFVVENIEPSCRESSSAHGSTAYHYTLPIPQRGSLTLTLSCRTINEGEHSGDVMVFVDQKHWKHASKVFRMVVR